MPDFKRKRMKYLPHNQIIKATFFAENMAGGDGDVGGVDGDDAREDDDEEEGDGEMDWVGRFSLFPAPDKTTTNQSIIPGNN